MLGKMRSTLQIADGLKYCLILVNFKHKRYSTFVASSRYISLSEKYSKPTLRQIGEMEREYIISEECFKFCSKRNNKSQRLICPRSRSDFIKTS